MHSDRRPVSHVGALLAVTGFLVTSLLGVLVWTGQRMVDSVDTLEDKVEEHGRKLSEITTELRVLVRQGRDGDKEGGA